MPSVEYNDKDETILTLSPIESFWVRKALRFYKKKSDYLSSPYYHMIHILEEMEKD